MPDNNHAEWDIPEMRVDKFSTKENRYALVIPVINEGLRIRSQLESLHALSLNIDIIIADGGSTDGSLEPEFLKRVGLTALITKLGAGKLSAQLRCAYSWCLEAGYEGIVTVDGNNKDSMESVLKFIELLDAGYDYVQGSRYAPGGSAINTPLVRTLGNRFLHAPLLSLAAGKRFTDTTNGFRAYSKSYLLHPEVQPFRSVFLEYELLFYLTARAGQLGLRTTETGVRRAYPDTGKTPTKIKGFSGNFTVLRQLFKTALKHYHPKPS